MLKFETQPCLWVIFLTKWEQKNVLQTKRVVSGMRATGTLHLGHYQGVLKNWITLQYQQDCFFFVADWHALTTHYDDVGLIQAHTWNMMVDWLAAGLDPNACTLFVQSHVPEHAELHVLLSMVTPLSWLERVPSYKDQQEKLKQKDLATYGFLGYPLLQTADILLYKPHFVPVGEDQVAHLEFAREVARRFNHLYAGGQDIFREPQALLTSCAKLTGLDGQKMSKSYNNVIGLREEANSVRKKIQVMPTDPARIRRADPGEPTKCPVYALHQVYSTDAAKDWVEKGCRSASIGCLECKQVLIDKIIVEQAPIIEKGKEYEANPQRIQDIARAGRDVARCIAQKTMTEVKQVMGLSK